MISLSFDLATGIAKLATTTTIKVGAQIPVQVQFLNNGAAAAPGTVNSIQLALGKDAVPSDPLAYLETFTEFNDTTWLGVLDGTDSRLATYMSGKGPIAVDLELAVTLDSVYQVAPTLSVTVQPSIIAGTMTTLSTPTYYTKAQVDTLLASYALLTVAGHYRIKSDGSFQLWNSTQSKWHTLTVTGAAGAEQISIGAGES